MSIYYSYGDAPRKCSRCECFKGKLMDGEWKFTCSVGVCILVKRGNEEKKEGEE